LTRFDIFAFLLNLLGRELIPIQPGSASVQRRRGATKRNPGNSPILLGESVDRIVRVDDGGERRSDDYPLDLLFGLGCSEKIQGSLNSRVDQILVRVVHVEVELRNSSKRKKFNTTQTSTEIQRVGDSREKQCVILHRNL